VDCILCQVFKNGGPKSCQCNDCNEYTVARNLAEMPPPVMYAYQAPGNRNPPLTDAKYAPPPSGYTDQLDEYAPRLTGTSPIGPTDRVIPYPRSQAQQRIRWVREQWTIVGGPACTAPNQPGWGWIHNYGYMTIADTLKPAQQLPRFNTAAVDTDTILDRARASVMRALYGGGK
jgi:hypothetical protein